MGDIKNEKIECKWPPKRNSENEEDKDGVEEGEIVEKPWQLVREVGDDATWTVSSYKPGYGVERLRDNNIFTTWESNGWFPHCINLEFAKVTKLKEVHMYFDYTQDLSYTPRRISVKVGACPDDLTGITAVDLDKPKGWVKISLVDCNGQPATASIYQFAICDNHLYGTQSHMRLMKVFSPVEEEQVDSAFSRSPSCDR